MARKLGPAAAAARARWDSAVSLQFRSLSSEDELHTAQVVADRSAGVHLDEGEFERCLAYGQPRRWMGAFDGDRMVGSTRNVPLRLTLPGGDRRDHLPELPAANAGWTGVLPSHRRRGILRAMQRWHVDDAREHGEFAFFGTPSQSSLYERFEHGPVVYAARVRIDTCRAAFRAASMPAATVECLERAEALDRLPPIFDRYRRTAPGEVTRSPAMWDMVFADDPGQRQGASGLFFAVCRGADSQGEGYVTYRLEHHPQLGRAANILQVKELIATTAESHAALWRFCLDMDLVAHVEAWTRVDDPLRWLLEDQRQVQTIAIVDRVWMRLLDPSRLLSSRGYLPGLRLSLRLVDRLIPDNSGSYLVDAESTPAIVTRGSRELCDIALTIGNLATLAMGAESASVLADAGRISEELPGGLARADAMFRSTPAPHCTTPI